MTLDLAQFHDTFFEESFEALDSMEAALLKLSAGEVDSELINTIFRVAHSIKGGAATFGFTEVAGFTHTAETLLDQMRAGKRQVTPDTRRPVPALRRSHARDAGGHQGQAAASTRRESPRCTARSRPRWLRTRVAATAAAPVTSSSGRGGSRAAGVAAALAAEPAGWRIRFVPGPELLRHGNDPLRMLRELQRARQVRRCASMR